MLGGGGGEEPAALTGGWDLSKATQLKRRPASSCSCHSGGQASAEQQKEGKREASGVTLGCTPPPEEIRSELGLFKTGRCGLECRQTASLSNSGTRPVSAATVSALICPFAAGGSVTQSICSTSRLADLYPSPSTRRFSTPGAERRQFCAFILSNLQK